MSLKLKFIFSIDSEISLVEETLKDFEWLKSHHYRFNLPAAISPQSSKAEIKKAVTAEFSPKNFQKIAAEITAAMAAVDARLIRALHQNFPANIPAGLKIFLTIYGVGGSYFPPDVIVLNINNYHGISTIFHEFIHILIEPMVIKYQVDHYQKERLVDLILHSPQFAFLKYRDWQDNYFGAEKVVDPLFNRYFFQNQDKFFSELVK